jgi:hypothetical protein
MPVHRSVLALSLGWLGPFAQETGRKQPFPGNDFDRPRLALRLQSPLGYPGVASFGIGDSALTVAADSQNEHNSVTIGYRGLFRHVSRLPFPFCNQKRLTPYTNVLFLGSRGGDYVAVNSIPAATDSRC